jgi:hypothetical protein
MEPEVAERLAEIRRMVDTAVDLPQMREAVKKMCDLVEALVENLEYLNEGEEGEMASFPH